MLARFTRVVLFVRSGEALIKATEFYHSALGLQVVRVTDEWAELRNGMGPRQQQEVGDDDDDDQRWSLSLQAVTTESQLSTGYSPILNFEVEDMDSTVSKCVQMGAHLDGPIQYPAHGKVAAMRTPDGHMIGLYEPATG